VLSNWTLEHLVGLAPAQRRAWGDLLRAVTTAAAILLAGAHAFVYARMLATTVEVRVFEDYGIFDESARRLVDGGDLYDVDGPIPPGRKGRPRAPNLNPPHFHLLLLPLTRLSPLGGFAIWMTAGLAGFLLAVLLIARTARLSIWGTGLLGAAAFISPAMIATIITGQVGLLLLVPFTLAWRSLRRDREVEAGVWLGLCAGTKLFLLLFVVYLAFARRWRAALAMSATLATLFLVGLAVFGVDAYRHWLAQLGGVSWAEHYMNASLLGLTERSLSASDWPYTPLADAPWLVRPIWAVALAVVLWRGGRTLAATPSLDRHVLVVTAAMLLLSPLGWVYYLFLLMPPLAGVLAADHESLDRRGRLLLLAGIGLLLVPAPVPWMTLQWDNGLVTTSLGGVYTWGLLVVFLAATRGKSEPRRHEDTKVGLHS
jgi:hypothetical protein